MPCYADKKGDDVMSDAKDILSLLPEAYFDLIARFVPGVIAVIILANDPSNKYYTDLYEVLGIVGLVLLFL